MLRLSISPTHLNRTSSILTTSLKNTTRQTRLAIPRPQYIQPRHRTLATMSTQSKACCTIPPVISEGYKEKGEWINVEGMKTYATGPKTAKSALLIIYDIFGFFPQTLQGADILAHSDKEHQYQVFMPDFFDGKPADISWYPPDTKEKGEKLGQ
jgi:hypothetical protein